MAETKELEGFDEFWVAYPRKRDKIAAMRMYKRALKMTTSAEILRAARLYAGEVSGKAEQFTKHAATWLNAGGWGNYPPPAKPVDPAGYYASFISHEMDAWTAYGRSIGKSYPKDRSGGWYFPTQWPPGYESTKAA